METVTTREGRQVTLLSQHELIDPVEAGEYIRAYCPVHGSQNQRSLSIHRESGWGRCFNASCPAYGLPGERSTVLVVEWNTLVASHLTGQARNSADPGTLLHTEVATPPPIVRSPPKPPPDWQQEELAALYRLYRTGFLRHAVRHPWAQAYLLARHIPPEVARSAGVGYLPAAEDLPFDPWRDPQYRGVGRWCQRLIFPLGVRWHDQVLRMGFIGRTLSGWHPGMDENEHKAFVDEYDREAEAQGRQPLRR